MYKRQQLTDKKIKSVSVKESLPFKIEPDEVDAEQIEVNDEINLSDEDSQITLDF